MNRKKDIVKTLVSISGKYSPYEVFMDWTKCFALVISNNSQIFHDKLWNDREKEYCDVVCKYNEKELDKFVDAYVMLLETMCGQMGDVLGEIFMEMEMGSKNTGQFFTPYDVSLMNAQIILQDLQPDKRGYYHLHEPSCGSGGMIVAAAQILKEKGINYQKKLKVIAQDLDWKAVYMCYLQLSLYGIKAMVVQGDTLSEPYKKDYPEERVLYTPAARGMLL